MDFIIYETHKDFKKYFENYFHLNYTRKYPENTYLDYLIGYFNAYFIKGLEVQNILKSFERDGNFNNVYDFTRLYYAEIGTTVMFLEQEITILKNKMSIEDALVITSNKNGLCDFDQFPPEVLSLFRGDKKLIELVFYFNLNFASSDKRFTATTKFNQIYFYVKEEIDASTFGQSAYIIFVQQNFDISYNPSRINGRNADHMQTLRSIHSNFNTLSSI